MLVPDFSLFTSGAITGAIAQNAGHLIALYSAFAQGGGGPMLIEFVGGTIMDPPSATRLVTVLVRHHGDRAVITWTPVSASGLESGRWFTHAVTLTRK
jgi:hypothetical protein